MSPRQNISQQGLVARIGYLVKKDDMFSRFTRCRSVTDRRTYGRTDRISTGWAKL